VYSEKLLMIERGSLKHAEFYSKNKFEELVHLVDIIIRMRDQVSYLDTTGKNFIFMYFAFSVSGQQTRRKMSLN